MKKKQFAVAFLLVNKEDSKFDFFNMTKVPVGLVHSIVTAISKEEALGIMLLDERVDSQLKEGFSIEMKSILEVE